jgi:hypothetical protein
MGTSDGMPPWLPQVCRRFPVGGWLYIDLRPLPQLPAGAVHAVDATGRRGGSQCRAGWLNYRPLKPGGAVLTAVAYTCFQGVGLIEISNHGH